MLVASIVQYTIGLPQRNQGRFLAVVRFHNESNIRDLHPGIIPCNSFTRLRSLSKLPLTKLEPSKSRRRCGERKAVPQNNLEEDLLVGLPAMGDKDSFSKSNAPEYDRIP